jgi:putative nucleotidyltransferase with HDIG domain
VFEVFKGGPGDKAFDISRFWQHSIGCGSAARMLARRLNYHLTGEAFVAGLLHDIGKIVMRQYLAAEFAAVMDKVSSGGMDLDEAEMEVVGTSHAQVGAWLAEKWNLPRLIVDGIAFHHDPCESREDPILVGIVTVANHLCHLNQIGGSGRLIPKKPGVPVWDIFRKSGLALDESDLSGLQAEFLMEFDKTDLMLSSLREGTEHPAP